MYNMIFEENSKGKLILAALGLTTADLGRYRDCHISKGRIAVYTRNGGGNRDCWCTYNRKFGRIGCKHHIVIEEELDRFYVEEKFADNFPVKYSVYRITSIGKEQLVSKGNMVQNEYYFCDAPASIECACPGCIISYRLPKHPNYISDKDDGFDETYATIYFSIPEGFEMLRDMDIGEWNPDKQWKNFLESLESSKITNIQKENIRPVIDALHRFFEGDSK